MASEFIEHNPMLKAPVLAVMSICVERPGASRAVIEAEADAAWDKSFNQVPSSIVDALVREGYLVEQIVVDGEPYGGALEDVYRDEAVPDDAEVDALLTATEAGARVLQDYDPVVLTATLFDDRPAYVPVFEAALAACSTPGGASRDALEHAIEDALETGSITSSSGGKVYPQYFIDALETAGALVWDGAWHENVAAGNRSATCHSERSEESPAPQAGEILRPSASG